MEALGARSVIAAPQHRAALRVRSARRVRAARAGVVRASSRPDHEVMGMYIYGAGVGVRAAPVDVRTGEFLASGLSTPVASPSQEALGAAVKKLVEQAEWTGHIGIGMPGRVQDFGGSSAADWAAGRASRAATERMLEQATGCRVVALGGAEACGAAEVAYGAARDAPGLVMTTTVGAAGVGVALFEDGELVRGVDVRSVLSSWAPPGAACAPPPGPAASPAEWAAWAERVDRILLQLDSVLHPQRIVLGGSAVREGGADRLISLLTVRDRVPGGVSAAQLGLLGGVKGAAWAAAREFRTRAALTAVRSALGASERVAPAALGADRLRAVFAQYAVAPPDGGPDAQPQLTQQALGRMLKALGVSLDSAAPAAGEGADADGGDAALRRVFAALDGDGSGGIVFDEFAGWWDAQVRPPAGEEGPVALVVSSEELEAILAEEPAGKLVCLEVGMTFCRPCKAFEKTYKAVAAETPAVRFLRLNGNENRSCTALARDTLGVRSTPAFYFFRAGPPAAGSPPGMRAPIDSHTGANEQRLRDALARLLAPPAAAGDAAAAAAAATPAPPPRVEAGKIDTSDAKRSGLAELLGKLSVKQQYLDKLRAQARGVEKEIADLQDELERLTGHPRKQGPGSR